MNIRPITAEDWDTIMEIQLASFPPTTIESRETLQSMWIHSPGSCLIAASLGYILSHPWIADDLPPTQAEIPGIPQNSTSLFIHDLAVSPKARGLGLAKTLVSAALGWARNQNLESASLIAVQNSQTFWQHMGFEPRPELKPRFEEIVRQNYQVDFTFMTARLSHAVPE